MKFESIKIEHVSTFFGSTNECLLNKLYYKINEADDFHSYKSYKLTDLL